MKAIDERQMQKTTNEKQTKTERSKENRSCSEMVRAKWFFCAQVEFRVSLINYFKTKKIIWVKACFGRV